jgi:hypothetical protein
MLTEKQLKEIGGKLQTAVNAVLMMSLLINSGNDHHILSFASR